MMHSIQWHVEKVSVGLVHGIPVTLHEFSLAEKIACLHRETSSENTDSEDVNA
jgi:hypothetical protein